MLIKVAKVVVIHGKNKVLLLRRGSTAPSRPGTWDLAGGIIKPEELSRKTAIRELEEETGIKTSSGLKLVLQSQRVLFQWSWDVYLLEVTNRHVDLSWEHDQFKWVPIDEVDQTEGLPKFIKRFIKTTVKGLKQP